MFTANQFRAKAAEYAELLKNTDNPREIKEFQRSKQSFSQLAHNEDWLAANFDKIIHSQDGESRPTTGLSPKSRSIFFAASELLSSCSGTRFRRNFSASCLIPQVR